MNIIKKAVGFCSAIALLLSASMGIAYADEEKEDGKNPLGCRDVGYQFNLKVLELLPEQSGDRQSLYFMFNNLDQAINLYQMRKEDSTRSMYLNHVIRPHQWAVLSTSEKKVQYICTVDNAKLSHGKIIDCAQSIKVCEYARVRYGMNNKGNYWLVSSNSKNGAVRDVVHYGIIPQ